MPKALAQAPIVNTVPCANTRNQCCLNTHGELHPKPQTCPKKHYISISGSLRNVLGAHKNISRLLYSNLNTENDGQITVENITVYIQPTNTIAKHFSSKI